MRCRAPSSRRSVVAGRRRPSPRRRCGETAPIRCSTGSRSHGATGSTQRSSEAWCCSTFRTSTRSSATTATKSIGSLRSRISSCGSSSRRSTPTLPCTSVTCARSHRTQLRWRSLSTNRICCRRRTSLPGATTWLGSSLRMALATSRSWSSRPARGRASKSCGSCSADALPLVGLRSSVSRLTSPMLLGRWRARAGPARPPASATTIELACSRRSRTPPACRPSCTPSTPRTGVAARWPPGGRSCAGSGVFGLTRCVGCDFPRRHNPRCGLPARSRPRCSAHRSRPPRARSPTVLPRGSPRRGRGSCATPRPSREAELPDRLDRAVSGTDLHVGRPRWWRAAAFLQRVFAAATIVGMLWLLALAVLGYLHIDEVVPLPELWDVPIPTLFLLGGIAAGVVFAFVFRLVNAASGRRRGRSAARSLRRQIEEVAKELVLGPVEAELESYAQLRKAIEAGEARNVTAATSGRPHAGQTGGATLRTRSSTPCERARAGSGCGSGASEAFWALEPSRKPDGRPERLALIQNAP